MHNLCEDTCHLALGPSHGDKEVTEIKVTLNLKSIDHTWYLPFLFKMTSLKDKISRGNHWCKM